MMFAQLAIILAAALIAGMIARRVGLPAMVGELIAGVLLGPSLLGLLLPRVSDALFDDGAPSPLVEGIGQFGVLLLVGLAATELDTEVLRRRIGVVSSVSLWAFGIPLGGGVAVGFLVPVTFHGEGSSTLEFALLLGAAMSLSAIPVIAKILTDLGLMRGQIGQITLAAGTINDIGAWLLLAAVSAMTTVGLRGWQLPLTVLSLAAVILATIVLRPWVRRGLDRLESSTHKVHVTALVVIIIAGGAAVTDALHLEAVLGAFLAGLLVGERDATTSSPLRTVTTAVLAPVFLATAGLHLDLLVLGEPGVALLALAVLVVAVATKLLGGYVGARLARVGRWEALAYGSGLNARGVVGIIVATVGLELGVFTDAVYMVVVLVAVVTSIMAGPMVVAAVRRADTSGGAGVPDPSAEANVRAPAVTD
ncbi:cation:proton antiporter [Gordonia sp. PKS22-38]|uniref:Cation:proton antiporter n=1 Tax=Gordonia prachuapensis TaxID=3115651 RepID=A0ABU7MS34_9ACTN|nr:cation:proton antiporter [Gordonia sp. PKS22-38]